MHIRWNYTVKMTIGVIIVSETELEMETVAVYSRTCENNDLYYWIWIKSTVHSNKINDKVGLNFLTGIVFKIIDIKLTLSKYLKYPM